MNKKSPHIFLKKKGEKSIALAVLSIPLFRDYRRPPTRADTFSTSRPLLAAAMLRPTEKLCKLKPARNLRARPLRENEILGYFHVLRETKGRDFQRWICFTVQWITFCGLMRNKFEGWLAGFKRSGHLSKIIGVLEIWICSVLATPVSLLLINQNVCKETRRICPSFASQHLLL